MHIFPENLATLQEKKIVVKNNLEEIFANLIQTLTSELGSSIQKHAGSSGAASVEGEAKKKFF